MEFHIRARIRAMLGFSSTLYGTTGNLILPDFAAARSLAGKIRSLSSIEGVDVRDVSAGKLNAMGLVDEILHRVVLLYRERKMPDFLPRLGAAVAAEIGAADYDALLTEFCREFPPREVYQGVAAVEDWLEGKGGAAEGLPGEARALPGAEAGRAGVPNRETALEELLLLRLANENPAFQPYRYLFDDGTRLADNVPDSLVGRSRYAHAFAAIEKACAGYPGFGPEGAGGNILELLRAPARMSPGSLEGQLKWIRENWGAEFDEIGLRILRSLDFIAEEEAPQFAPGPGPAVPYVYAGQRREYEKFTLDRDWMPSLVLIAKNALVWLHQLSESYGRPICRLDGIPDAELDAMADRGINGLWLIGLWERSPASERIKRLCGNPEAAASAYSLFDYDIAQELGGWEALDRLRDRCMWRGIRLAADMVPNHTGIDSRWIRTRPDLFLGLDRCPFPSYTFTGADLSGDPSVGIWLEDHYYDKMDAAVVFKRLDRSTGRVRYIYHGNDGTGMAWNDTAQIDFMNPEARAAVKERIINVAKHFSIIRFDAAMVLARQHIHRLWYPAPGSGGAIPSRSESGMGDEEYDKAMPREFWREVVDECAEKAPETLLLAEAFWMMEGYFVRTLGMHRVYNSAFMNMLKAEKNSLYRLTIKNTQEFDRQILKRYVNFMSNPDEETAIAQFGSGDKYFGVCTLMATMPGLPMFAHGQIEGFAEKYGMEYRRSYKKENPDQALVRRHEREIFPLLRKRKLFAEVEHFHLFDFVRDEGVVDENVFAYSNGSDDARALIFYNNYWERTSGHISISLPYSRKDASGERHRVSLSLVQALDLDPAPGNYLLAREMKTGLWHIYRCGDLNSGGWRVSLEGYQAMVFTDFTRVRDTDGSYETLWKQLKGSGVTDLDSALEEASRPELYRSLEKALDAITDFAKATVGDEGAETERRLAEEAGEAVEIYFSRLASTIAEDEGLRPGIDTVSQCRRVFDNGLALAARLRVFSMDETPFSGKGREANASVVRFLRSRAGFLLALHYAFIAAVSRLLEGDNRSEEMRYVLEKFLVRRKVREAARRFRLSGPSEAGEEEPSFEERILSQIDPASLEDLSFAFATRPPKKAPPSKAPGAKEGRAGRGEPPEARSRAIELLQWANNDHKAREALGINLWEGTEYFNKERFEAMLVMAPVFGFMENVFAVMERKPASLSISGLLTRKMLKELFDAETLRGFDVRDVAAAGMAKSGFVMQKLISIIESGS